MGSDAAIVSASAPRDLARKKKTNRSARLKQCKLDARREQWLSQGKNKECKATDDLLIPSSPSIPGQSHVGNQTNVETRNGRLGSVKGRDQGLSIDIPVTKSWENSMETNCPNNSLGSFSISSRSSCSRSISDADDYDEDEGQSGGGEEGGGLDDWEAVADALTSESPPVQLEKDIYLETHLKKDEDVASVDAPPVIEKQCDPSRGILRTPPQPRLVLRAWKPDDAFRPRSLPNLSKQRCFSKNMIQTCGVGNAGWTCGNFDFQPLSCPICFEDLDLTDTSFLPCSCGFRLCLFCHKRIIESDGRCPGCRKQYSSITGSAVPVGGGAVVMENRLSHSRSMNAKH